MGKHIDALFVIKKGDHELKHRPSCYEYVCDSRDPLRLSGEGKVDIVLQDFYELATPYSMPR